MARIFGALLIVAIVAGLTFLGILLGPTIYTVYFRGPAKAETIAEIERIHPEWKVTALRQRKTEYFSPQGGGDFYRVYFEGTARLEEDLFEFLDWDRRLKLCGESIRGYKSDDLEYYYKIKSKGDEVTFKGDMSASRKESGELHWGSYRIEQDKEIGAILATRTQVMRNPSRRIVDETSRQAFCEKLRASVPQ